MHLRVSHQHNGMTVIQSTEDTSSYFAVGARFSLIYEDKALYIEKTPRGTCECIRPSPKDMAGVCSRLFVEVIKDSPAFHVAEAEFTLDGDLLTWLRPPIWALPWTIRAPKDVARSCAANGLTSRLRSARRNMIDPQRVTKSVPAWAKSALEAGEWMSLVREVFPCERV